MRPSTVPVLFRILFNQLLSVCSYVLLCLSFGVSTLKREEFFFSFSDLESFFFFIGTFIILITFLFLFDEVFLFCVFAVFIGGNEIFFFEQPRICLFEEETNHINRGREVVCCSF